MSCFWKDGDRPEDEGALGGWWWEVVEDKTNQLGSRPVRWEEEEKAAEEEHLACSLFPFLYLSWLTVNIWHFVCLFDSLTLCLPLVLFHFFLFLLLFFQIFFLLYHLPFTPLLTDTTETHMHNIQTLTQTWNLLDHIPFIWKYVFILYLWSAASHSMLLRFTLLYKGNPICLSDSANKNNSFLDAFCAHMKLYRNSDLCKEKVPLGNWRHLNIIRVMCDDRRLHACLICTHTQKNLCKDSSL